MSYQSLYRKYRPKTFDQVVGQSAIVNALSNALKTNHISHAYLFTGPRGTGKTTIAKLFASAVNCETSGVVMCGQCENCRQALGGQHPDIVEIDAASNNGVDEIRSLIEKVKYMPILGKYKVYIIDEVHMLSQGAFNALLKTLEEPPEHVIFILATTEVHKVIPTIISRCQRYDFGNIGLKDIEKQLDYVLQEENRQAEPGTTQLIASLSAGGMRNALTILEQAFIINLDSITLASLYENFGLIFPQDKIRLFTSINNGDIAQALELLSTMIEKSVDLARLLMNLITGLKDSLIYTYTQNDNYINLNDREFIHYLAHTFSTDKRTKMTDILLDRYDKIKGSVNQETHLELAILSLVDTKQTGVDEIVVESQPVKPIVKSTVSSEPVIKTPVQQEQETLNLDFADTTIEDDIDIASGTHEETSPITPSEPVIQQTQETLNLDIADTSQEDKADIVSGTRKHKLDISVEEIVQLMVTADKDIRKDDEPHFKNINNYLSDLTWARVSRLLSNTQLVLSGAQFVLVVTQRQIQSREIMEERNLYELMDFVEHLVGKKKQVFATTSHDFTKAVEQFKIASKQNTLPQPLDNDEFMSHTVMEAETVDRDESLEAVKSLFGDHVRII